MFSLPTIDNKTILTATEGFLAGYTHTINLHQGCSFAGSLCGLFCYAQHNVFITKRRTWRLYGSKANIRDPYRAQYDALKRPGRGEPKPLSVFMCSSTDPYVPQEATLRLVPLLLEEMLSRPPDVLVVQTRNPLVGRDIDLIYELSRRCEVWLSVTVETDMERVPGLPPHATSPKRRIGTLRAFKDRGVQTQATVSPLLPLADAERFARDLGEACDRVIVDHYLLGDGSPGGLRTKQTDFPRLLEEAGFSEWNRIEKFWEVKAAFDRVLGPERVLVSSEGFNKVGTFGPIAPEGRPASGGEAQATAGQASAPVVTSRCYFSFIVENHQRLLDDLRRRQAVVRDRVRGVALGYANGLYLYGSPGTAKTHTVCDVLEEEVKKPYHYQQGHLTPLGLFDALAEHPDEVIVFDDLAHVLKSDVALQILFAALGDPTGRNRERVVTDQRRAKERQVIFTGGVICISNLELHDDKLLDALKSRVHVLNYNPSNAHLGALMLDIARRGWSPRGEGAEVSPAEAVEVARVLIGELVRTNCKFDLRLFVKKALPDYLQWKDGEAETDWRDLARASVEEHLAALRHGANRPFKSREERLEEEREIVSEIVREHATHEERVAAWAARTGKSARAFSRRKAEIDNR
jgi:DNA repair photolyase